ncbi:glycosyl transferase [Pseudomonas sp. C9-3]|uniref:glycosyl transferase n=1 Tax=Pseudomonas sp. C9-3 TaxID=3078264 RepID=UPI0028EC02FC|nr:glycosyl transferase [Pseudomonas sp. C9-3]
MRLIYLSPVPWSSFAQRPQKFVEWFHLRTGGEVFWVDPYPTRLPQLNDFKRPEKSLPGEAQEYYSWLQLAIPRALPIEPLPGIAQINRLCWGKLLDQLQVFAGAENTLIVVGKPSHLALRVLAQLPDVPSVYDAMDEFPAFYKGLSRASMMNCEKRLVERVDKLWVTSTRLKHRWSNSKPNLQLVPNGLDQKCFSSAGRQKKDKQESKTFGYVGTIAAWFDWAWVIRLAELRPNDRICLIGPVFAPPRTPLPNNVQLLPPCNHADAMKALLGFDVGIIPFRENKLTASVDPIKYYEYRASGLPVLSTDFGEMKFRRNEPGAFISGSIEDISSLAAQALSFNDDQALCGDFAAKNSWNTRFDGTNLLMRETSV